MHLIHFGEHGLSYASVLVYLSEIIKVSGRSSYFEVFCHIETLHVASILAKKINEEQGEYKLNIKTCSHLNPHSWYVTDPLGMYVVYSDS